MTPFPTPKVFEPASGSHRLPDAQSFEPVTVETLGGNAALPAADSIPFVPGSNPGTLYAPSSSALARETAIIEIRDRMQDRGLSASAAAREAGIPRASFDRWSARYDVGGLEALEDNYANCGRKPLATLDAVELNAARKLYLETGSVTAALGMLAASPECSQETADAITKKRRSKHIITPTLRKQISSVPQAVLDYHKSPKKVTREAFINPRSLSFIGKDRTEQRILPGMFCERDDMSNNFLFWVDWPWGGDPCSDKYGVRIARGQNLLHIDVGSLRFLSYLLLVRLRDSYRADDIWQWVGQSYRDIGIPEIGERWERGIWQAKKLQGTPIEGGHTDQETRLGGIAGLGRKIITSQPPTTKIIENRFRYFQRVCATIPGQIGASRGEMEKVNKIWTACREGRRDPRDYFLSYEDTCRQLDAKLQWVNSESVEGTIYHGIPNDLWVREGGDQRMTRLTAGQSHLFARDRHVVTINKGHALIRKTAPDGKRQGWYFYHENLWRLEGRRVALYMDDFAPATGATIVAAEGQSAGEVICQGEMVDGCPQFALSLTSDIDDTRACDAIERRKKFGNAVRAEYRALGINHTIAKGTYASDGRGRSGSAETSAPLQPAAPARTRDIKPARTPEPTFDDIERLEAEAFARGDLAHL